MWKRTLALVLTLAGTLDAPQAQADVATLSPVRTAVLPPDESGLTRVALAFDLTSLRDGPGRQIDQALLVWGVDGIPIETTASWAVQEITAPWTAPELTSGRATLQCSDDVADAWDITPYDRSRTGDTPVRLEIRDAVERWASGRSPNLGVLVTTPDVGPADAIRQIGKVQLLLWYGFGPATELK